MENLDEEIEKMCLKLDMQFKNIEKIDSDCENAKRKLTFLKLANTFKERKDTYYVGITVSRDLEEVERIIGGRYPLRETHYGFFLIIVIILPEILQSSLKDLGFKMNLSVLLAKTRVCKTVRINAISPVVIPSTDFPIGSELDISFFGKINETKVVFRIPTIVLNLSYFLRSNENINDNCKCENYKEKLVRISKQYIQLNEEFLKDHNIKCTLTVQSTFNFSDIGLKVFPDNLNKSSFKDGNSVEWTVLKNSSLPSLMKLVRIEPNFIEVESDAENLLEIKKFFANQMFNHIDFEILAMRNLSRPYDSELFSQESLPDRNHLEKYYQQWRRIWYLNISNYK